MEVWSLKEEDRHKLTAEEILTYEEEPNVKMAVTNDEILEFLEATETVVQRVEKRGLQWFGHLLRTDDRRQPKHMFTWRAPGRNKRGQPISRNDGMRF